MCSTGIRAKRGTSLGATLATLLGGHFRFTSKLLTLNRKPSACVQAHFGIPMSGAVLNPLLGVKQAYMGNGFG